jgi:integrase
MELLQMAMRDRTVIQSGIVIYRRSDVDHHQWYCRLKVPKQNRYKVVSLDTPDMELARDKAVEQYAELLFKVKFDLPIFEKHFGDIADEYIAFQQQRVKAKEITQKRCDTEEGYVENQLKPHLGSTPISQIKEDHWREYPMWRRGSGKGRYNDGMVSDWTIRSEMATFRAIMMFAVKKKYIPEASAMFRARLKLGKPRREAFTLTEYRKLYTFAREWIKKAPNVWSKFSRTMFHNFTLIMTNTGMRPIEARNLRWRDIGEVRRDRNGRPFLPINVRGKDKFRELVAPDVVAGYLENIRKISKATKPDDFVFTTFEGQPAKTLYKGIFDEVMRETGLLLSPTGKPRSIYSYRHTYATFRIMENTDRNDLAEQMGTSPEMLKDYYAHVKPSDTAHRVLQGMPGWEADFKRPEKTDGLKAGRTGRKPGTARARTRRGRSQTAGTRPASRSTRPGGWPRTR